MVSAGKKRNSLIQHFRLRQSTAESVAQQKKVHPAFFCIQDSQPGGSHGHLFGEKHTHTKTLCEVLGMMKGPKREKLAEEKLCLKIFSKYLHKFKI